MGISRMASLVRGFSVARWRNRRKKLDALIEDLSIRSKDVMG